MKAKASPFTVAFFLHTFGVMEMASPLPSCSTERPGSWATHRTLYLPSSMVSEEATDDEISWTNVLCCVYTYVKTSDDVDKPEFELYDGSSYKIKKDTALEVMYEAYEDICDMSMGSKDCSNQAECIADALNPPQPVPLPTTAPAGTPTAQPTQAPVDGCADASLAFKNKKKRDCAWVGKKGDKRCKKKWKGIRLWDYCPVTCGVDCR